MKVAKIVPSLEVYLCNRPLTKPKPGQSQRIGDVAARVIGWAILRIDLLNGQGAVFFCNSHDIAVPFTEYFRRHTADRHMRYWVSPAVRRLMVFVPPQRGQGDFVGKAYCTRSDRSTV